MYEASDLFKSAISQKNRELRLRCTIDEIVYTETDIQSCSVEESILTGEDFKFGSSTASRFEITLLNIDESLSAKSFEGKDVHIEIGAVLDKFHKPIEYVSLGYFFVEEASKEKGLIKLTGYDKMIYFEKPYNNNLTYPATLLQILQDITSKAGVTLENTSFLNHDYMINESPDFADMTLRAVLEHISELACSFACINRNGNLELITLTDTDITINRDNYYSMNLSEYEYGPLNHLIINNNGVIEELGSGANTIEIKDNIFALSPTPQLLTNILNAIEDFTFKPFSCSWQGNVLTSPGDVINVSYKTGETYKSFIANQKFTFSVGLKCDISTNARTVIQNEYKTKGPITKELAKAKSRIEQTEESITLAVERLGEAEAKIEIQADQISLKVNQSDYNGETIGSLINLSPSAIDIQAGKLNLIGYITATSLSTPGATIIDGSNIQTGTMSADAIFGGWLRFSNNSSIYEGVDGYTQMVFSSLGYKFEGGGTIDFSNNPVIGLNVTASFG